MQMDLVKLHKKLGYDVFVMWEGEYNTNKMKIKKEIKNFLNDT